MPKLSIAFLSGKGGAGKTFISTNFANSIHPSTYVDTDVEEPNGNIFFPSNAIHKIDVKVKIPKFNYQKCTGCRACADFCKFNAIVFIKRPFLVPEVCHSCEGCYHICKYDAISLIDKTVGEVEISIKDDHQIISGKMNVGEMSGTPIIRKTKEFIENDLSIIDCPPGNSCLVLEAISDVDYCVLVAESTLFGFYNFKSVYHLCRELNKPLGIIINKYDGENQLIKNFAAQNHIEILDIFPFEKRISDVTSAGKLISDSPSFAIRFQKIYQQILKQLSEGKKDE